MRILAVLVALVAITSIATAQNAPTNNEPRTLQLIQLKYLDVGTVIRLFGGSIIPTTGYNSQDARSRSRRGGYSRARTGSQVGGSATTPRTYGYQPQINYLPTPNTSQQYDAF